MPKSRNRKNHKKKVAARRQRMEHAKRRVEKMQRQLLEQLIAQENQQGMFDNLPQGPEIPTDSDGPIIEGPSI